MRLGWVGDFMVGMKERKQVVISTATCMKMQMNGPEF